MDNKQLRKSRFLFSTISLDNKQIIHLRKSRFLLSTIYYYYIIDYFYKLIRTSNLNQNFCKESYIKYTIEIKKILT